MRRLHYPIPNNLSLLHDQLLAAFPSLRPVSNPQGGLEAKMGLEGNAAGVWLTVPDDADEAGIEAVVRAHDPAEQQLDPARERQTRISELLAIKSPAWTASQRNELLRLVAQECIPASSGE